MFSGEPARKRFREGNYGENDATRQLVDCILDPESCRDGHRWPNTMGVSSIYKTKNIINASFDASGRSMVAVYPRINNAIFYTKGGTYSGGWYTIGNAGNPYTADNIAIPVSQKVLPWTAPIYIGGLGSAILPCPKSFSIASSGYAPLYAFQITTASNTASITINADNSFIGSVVFYLTGYNSSGAVVQTLASTYNSTNNTLVIQLSTSFTTAVQYISLSANLLGLTPFQGPVTMEFSDTSNVIQYTVPNVSQFCAIQDLKDSTSIQSTSTMGFVMAQSLLVTFEGSTLNNGGQLSIARVPGDTGLGTGTGQQFNDLYSWIASLAVDNYDGRLSDGGYAWYLGQDPRAYFYRNIGDLFQEELPFIVSEFTTDDTSEPGAVAAVRVKVTTCIQFTSNSSVYAKAPSEYIGGDLEKVYWILSNVPAAFANGSHKDAIKAKLKQIGGNIWKMVKPIVSNPATYATLAGMIL